MLMEIITTDWILGIAGTIIIGLFVAVIKLITHIWKERKEMLSDEKKARAKKDEQFNTELTKVKDMHGAVAKELAGVSENLKNLTGWFKSVQNEQKQLRNDLQVVEVEVEKFKGKRN